MEKNGWGRFAHVKLPASVAEISGLVFEDVAEHARYSTAESCYIVPDNAPLKANLAQIIEAEINELSDGAATAAGIATLGEFVEDGSDF